jgi:hypothetical protein
MFLALSFLLSWGGGLCAVVTAAPVVFNAPATPQYRWDNGYLYQGSQLIGCHNGQSYFNWVNGGWVAGTAPTPVPGVPENFGVDMSKIGTPGATINGKPCTKAQAFQAIEKGGTLSDDSSKLRLTIYGDGRERVTQDLGMSPQLAEFKGHLLVQSYPAGHWALEGFAAPEAGKPTILVQDATGKVLHRQSDYDGTAALAEALRRVNPNYDPSKDKDLRKSVSVASVVLWLQSKSPLGVAWWVVLATVGVLYFINSKKETK